MRIIILSLCTAVLLRIAILFIGSEITHTPIHSIANAHDGKEYITYTNAIKHLDLNSIPVPTRRLYPGYPLTIALLSFVFPYWVSGYIITFLGVILTIIFTHILFNSRQITFAAGFIYPAWLYYTSFVMSEGLFIALLLCAMLLEKKKNYYLCSLLLGFAYLTRPVALFLAIALFLSRIRKTTVKHFILQGIVFAFPPIVWYVIFSYFWSGTNAGYTPKFSFPFYPWLHLIFTGNIFTFKKMYISMIFLFFVITLIVEIYNRFFNRKTLENEYFLFFIFLLFFQLSLYSFKYYTIDYAFIYQDRYLIPLFPFALRIWEKLLNKWVLLLLGAGSTAISVYWMVHYIQAAKSSGII